MKSMNHKNQENKLQLLSRNLKQIGLLSSALITMTSCSKNDEPIEQVAVSPATAAQFASVRETALQQLTQNFTATAGSGEVVLTSEKGVKIKINTNNLTKNGNPITGSFDIKYVEIFDKGHMLSTNKSTMGKMPDGINQAIMKSGGEFYLNATQGGVQLATDNMIGTLKLEVPATLTGAVDSGMTFWTGVTTDPENIVWNRKDGGQVGFNQVPTGATNGYNVTFGNFGWSNIDRLYNLPGVKTQILATAPTGYNETNSAIYFSLDGEGTNQLAKFDVYNPTTMQFSEHYGQIPIGQACHLIFASAEGSQWRYAVKAVIVAAGVATNFTLAETVVGSESQMVAAINAIQ